MERAVHAASDRVRRRASPRVAPSMNLAEIVQLAPGASDVPQVFVCEYALALGPITVIPLIVSCDEPPLVNVAVCHPLVVLMTWLSKSMLLGFNFATDEHPTFVAS